MITIEREDQEKVEAKTNTIMRCPSIQEMTQMAAPDLGRDGATRRSPSGTIPETPGSVMDVGRRATSNATVDQPVAELEEEEQLEDLANAHTVTRPAIKRLSAGRSIQRRLPNSSRRRPRPGR